MRLRNGDHGYGAVTKLLHWLTVALIAGQFAVGYTMQTERDVPDVDCDPPGEGRSGGDTSAVEDERLDRVEAACEAAQDLREDAADDLLGTAWSDLRAGDLLDDGLSLPEAHILLGAGILLVVLARFVWRATTPLPPWDERLSAVDRKLLAVVERVLLALLVVIPLSGLALVSAGAAVRWHVGAHFLFFAALALHVGIVVRRRVLGRMLPG